MTRPPDPIRVRELLGHINQAAQRLRALGTLPQDSFLDDYRNTESAKYLFISATEAAIDLCNHIVVRCGGRAPETYADCFGVLAELDIIDDELAHRLKQMARFRNLLVHLYGDVDDERVYKSIHNDLADLDDFRRAIAAWMAL